MESCSPVVSLPYSVMRKSPRRVALLGLSTATLLALWPVATSARAYCESEEFAGCTIHADYLPQWDVTEWDMECGDGFSYHGFMVGNQEAALCG